MSNAKINAIIIDDNEHDTYLARRVLQRSGMIEDIREYVDPTEICELMGTDRWDKELGPHPPRTLVLLDINMPVMTGFEFLERVRELEEQGRIDTATSCIVLMLTSSAYFGDREKALGYDFVSDYVEKPFDKNKLTQILARHYPELSQREQRPRRN